MRVPIVQYREVLLTALQDDLTDRDALDLRADLIDLIEKAEPRGVVIDIGSIGQLDNYLVDVVRQTAEMTRLLGCETIVTGIQPTVAVLMADYTQNQMLFKTMLKPEMAVDFLMKQDG